MGRGKRWPHRGSDEPARAVEVKNFDRFSKRIRIPKSHDFRLFSIIGFDHGVLQEEVVQDRASFNARLGISVVHQRLHRDSQLQVHRR
jgi:hypothetical protein